MKIGNSVHTTGSRSLKKQLHPSKLTQMINGHITSSDSGRTQNWKRYMKAHEKPLYEMQEIDYNRLADLDFQEQLSIHQGITKDYVESVLDFDVNNFLDTETFGIIDFSKIKDDYLKKRNMEFFMILDETKKISIKKFNQRISSDTLILVEYPFNGRVDYMYIPLAVLSNILQIEDRSYEAILWQFLNKYGYKIKEEIDSRKHYRGQKNAA